MSMNPNKIFILCVSHGITSAELGKLKFDLYTYGVEIHKTESYIFIELDSPLEVDKKRLSMYKLIPVAYLYRNMIIRVENASRFFLSDDTKLTAISSSLNRSYNNLYRIYTLPLLISFNIQNKNADIKPAN